MLILRLVGLAVDLSWRRRLTRPVFYLTLLREGLTREEASLLCEEYNPRIPLRDLVHIGTLIEVDRPS